VKVHGIFITPEIDKQNHCCDPDGADVSALPESRKLVSWAGRSSGEHFVGRLTKVERRDDRWWCEAYIVDESLIRFLTSTEEARQRGDNFVPKVFFAFEGTILEATTSKADLPQHINRYVVNSIGITTAGVHNDYIIRVGELPPA
jgi:hypothetical protein